MSYIETLDRKYRSTTPLDIPQIMTGWKWVDWIIDKREIRDGMTPRETFDHWIKEGRLERFSS